MVSNLFSSVPLDVVAQHIFPHCMETWSDFANLSLVSHRFREAANVADEAHKRLFLAKWPTQSPNLKFSHGGWLRMFKRRIDWAQIDETPIEGCAVIFECPMKFDDLEGPVSGPLKERRRTCHECNKEVVRVSSKERAIELASQGLCVSFKKLEKLGMEVPWMGLMMAPPAAAPTRPGDKFLQMPPK